MKLQFQTFGQGFGIIAADAAKWDETAS